MVDCAAGDPSGGFQLVRGRTKTGQPVQWMGWDIGGWAPDSPTLLRIRISLRPTFPGVGVSGPPMPASEHTGRAEWLGDGWLNAMRLDHHTRGVK